MSFDAEHTKTLAKEVANRPLSLIITETGILALIALTALVGNICVLYVFYRTPRLRTVTSYYIIALAISDVAQAVFMMPLAIALSWSGKDVIGHTLGQIKGFVCASLLAGNLLTTALIALNRYFCVARPALYRRFFKGKPALATVIGVWIFVLLLTGFFGFMGWIGFEYFPGMHLYFVVLTKNSAVSLIVFYISLCIVFPLSSGVICYWKIYRQVKTHNAGVSSTLSSTRSASSLSKDEISLSLSLMALVIAFVVCWIPSIIVYTLALFMNLPRFVELIPTYFVYASSTINPMVYNIFNKPFRKEFCTMVLKKRAVVGARSINQGSWTA